MSSFLLSDGLTPYGRECIIRLYLHWFEALRKGNSRPHRVKKNIETNSQEYLRYQFNEIIYR